jgi:hypothetical protein
MIELARTRSCFHFLLSNLPIRDIRHLKKLSATFLVFAALFFSSRY